MPIRIKPAAQLKEKYSANAGAAVSSYKEGVSNPRRAWEEATRAAEGNYEAAVQEAIAEKRFGSRITPQASAKQKANAVALGATRYPQGVSQAKDEWAANTQPILDAMAAVPDIPRGVKGSEQNFQRQRAYANAAMEAAK